MADIIDEVEEELEIPAPEKAVDEDAVETTLEKELKPVKESNVKQESVEEELPEKYRGKSAKEIAEMHQQAEKLIGKQGSEVGELRKVVDDFISTQTSKSTQTEIDETSPEEFIDNPVIQ